MSITICVKLPTKAAHERNSIRLIGPYTKTERQMRGIKGTEVAPDTALHKATMPLYASLYCETRESNWKMDELICKYLQQENVDIRSEERCVWWSAQLSSGSEVDTRSRLTKFPWREIRTCPRPQCCLHLTQRGYIQ
jgi:hypothetical protein